MSISTIPNVTVSTVGTPVLTTNKIPVTYHYKPSLTTESLSSVKSPLTSRPKSSSQDLPWSPLCLVTDVAARTEPFRSSFTINEGTELDELYHPIGLCLLNNGNLVVASTFEHKVKLYLPSGVLQSIVQIPGRRFYKPTDMTALASGHFAVRDNDGLMIFSSEGRFLWKLETEDKSKCTGLAQDDTGHLVTIQKPKRGEAASLIFFDLNTGNITSRMSLNHVVREEDRWRSNCKFLTYCRGLLYVTDLGMDKVYILDNSARLVTVFGTTGDGPGCFNDPAGLGVDGEGNMVVADSRNHRVCLFTKEGKFVSNLNLSPKVMRPSGLLLDRVNKELYVLNINGKIALIKYSLQ